MSLDQRNKEEIYEQLERAVQIAQKRCNENTYKGRYGESEYINEWDIIEHVLSNGLHVYTVVCPEWHSVQDTEYFYGYRSNGYNKDIKNNINYYSPYPHIDYADSGLTIITVLSPYPLSKIDNINMTIRYKDINFMIPEEADKAVLIYNKSREEEKIKESYRYVLGAREITSKKILSNMIDYNYSWKPIVIDSKIDTHYIAWPVKEVVLECCQERHIPETIDIYGIYRDGKRKRYKTSFKGFKNYWRCDKCYPRFSRKSTRFFRNRCYVSSWRV